LLTKAIRDAIIVSKSKFGKQSEGSISSYCPDLKNFDNV